MTNAYPSSASDSKEATIVKLYSEGKTNQTVLADQFNVARSTVRKILLKHDVEIIDPSVIRVQNRVNLHYFDHIDREEKAYWLGFLAADGCVMCNTGRYRVILVLKEEDRSHVESFLQALESKGSIRIRTVRGNRYVRTHVSGKPLIKRLVELGITPRKSLTLKFPTLRPDMNRHFMRGYFDGDGCISHSIACNQLSFSVLGTKKFLETFALHLMQAGRVSNLCLYRAKPDSECHQLFYTGNNQVPKIMNWLYRDTTIFLGRKRKRYLELVQGVIQLEFPFSQMSTVTAQGNFSSHDPDSLSAAT